MYLQNPNKLQQINLYQLEFSGFWTKSQKSTKCDVICKHLSKNRRIPVTYYALEFSGIWTKTLRARLFCCPKPKEFQLCIRNWNFTGFGQQKMHSCMVFVQILENSSAQQVTGILLVLDNIILGGGLYHQYPVSSQQSDTNRCLVFTRHTAYPDKAYIPA